MSVIVSIYLHMYSLPFPSPITRHFSHLTPHPSPLTPHLSPLTSHTSPLTPHQVHMATAHGNLGEHQFGAPPHNWPLMGKTLPYWLDEGSNVG